MLSMPSTDVEPEPLEAEEELLASLADVVAVEEQDPILRELRTAHFELKAIFYSYAIDPTAAAEDEPAVGDEGINFMSLTAWKQMCSDTGVDGKQDEVTEAFNTATMPGTDEEPPALVEFQFYGALVRLAQALAQADQTVTNSLYALLYECILPFARRDTSTSFSQVMGSRSYLLPYLEEIRNAFSGFGISWEQWLKLWPQLKLAGLPGYPYWERQVFRALSENLGVLLRVFSFYSKQTLLRHLTAASRASAGDVPARLLVLGKPEWLTFIRECKLFSKKLGNERTVRQLTTAPGATAFATFAEFLAGVVKLSFWRANAFLDEGNPEQVEVARREFRVRNLPDCFISALQNHILPLAQRDSSQRFRARLAQDDGVQTLMRDYKDQLQETFVQLTADSGDSKPLECATALSWLEQCGVLGHSQVRGADAAAMPDPYTKAQKPLAAILTIEHATEAFVEATPAIQCLPHDLLEDEANDVQLTSLRHFQEWLSRCGAIKYGTVGHATIADRTAGILQNVFERRTAESVVLEAMMPPPAPRFNPAEWPPPPEMSRSELQLLIEAWETIDLSMLPGFPSFEQSTFELLAQCVAPLVGIFGYYSRSSLGHEATEVTGYIELPGWNDFIIDCNAITKSFSGLRAAEIFMDSPKSRDALSCPEFIQTVVICAFMRANTGKLDLMKRSAPRLIPTEQALHAFLNSNVLPLAKSRNLLEAHRTFQEDEELQRLLGDHSDSFFQLFLTAKPLPSPVGGDDESPEQREGESQDAAAEAQDADEAVDIEQFIQVLEDRGLFNEIELHLSVWENVITPVQPGEHGLLVTKTFSSSLTAVDARQAFLDTLLADALLISASLPNDMGACTGKLPASGISEAIVRCALAKFTQVNVLTTAGKTAALVDCLLTQGSDEQRAIEKFVDSHVPQRFDAGGAPGAPLQDPDRAASHQAWLSIWQEIDLSDLPGFPEWDGAAFEILQANWPTLLSIFIFYSRGYGGRSAGAFGHITPWGFLQWADDSKVMTKVFSDMRVRDIYAFTVAGESDSEATLAEPTASDEVATQLPPSVHGAGMAAKMMSFPAFVQAVVNCAVERANPRWRRDESGRLTTGILATYLISVPDCLSRFLHNCVLRFSPRDPGLAFSTQLVTEDAAKQAVEDRQTEVSAVFARISGVETRLTDTARKDVNIDIFTSILQERRLVGTSMVDHGVSYDHRGHLQKTGRLIPCELTAEQVSHSAADAATFVRGIPGASFSESEADARDAGGRLSAEEFVEMLVRCAHIKYANVPVMNLAQRVTTFLRILLDGDEPDAVNAKAGRPTFNAADEPCPDDMTEADHAAWFSVWGQIDLEGLPGFEKAAVARSVYIQLRTNMLPLMDIFCQYSKNNNADSSLTLDSWDSFVRDANLVTRAMGVQRMTAVFEHAAVTNKLNQPVLRFPQFLRVLVHIAYLRSNPVSALSAISASQAKPVPLHKSFGALLQHVFDRFMEPPPALPPKQLPPPKGAAKNAGSGTSGALPPVPAASSLVPKSPMAKGVIAGAGGQESRRGASRRAASPSGTSKVASTAAASGAPLPSRRGGSVAGGQTAARGLTATQGEAGTGATATNRSRGNSPRGPSPRSSSPTPTAKATTETADAQVSASTQARPVMRKPASAGIAGASRATGGSGMGLQAAAKAMRFDGLLPSMRKNLYARMWRAWLDYTRQSRADSSQVVAKFRDRKRGGKLTHLFESWRLWLAEWNTSINEAGFVLRPHLPLNQHSAFSHWRYWSHAPQLMTTISTWYMARVTPEDVAVASRYTIDTVTRAVNLKAAFGTWEKLHAQTVRAVSMTNHLQRRLCATLLLRVVDAWVRLTIQEHGARLYKERRMAGNNPTPPRTVPTTAGVVRPPLAAPDDEASAAEAETFLSRDLEPRMTAARPGAHAWALLEAKLQMHHLPGINEHLPRIHALLQESLPSLCSVFRSYAKLHIQPSEGLLSLSCLQLHEWLLFCEEVGLSSVSEPQQQLLMASQFENAQRRHLHGGLMSLPEFLEAFVCTSVLARREDARGHPIDVVTRVQRSLESLQPLVARDMAPGFRITFWADTQAMKLLQQHDAALRKIFLSRGWLRSGGVSLADFEAYMLELGLVCEGYWVQPLGSAGCELSMTLEQVMEAFVDSLDMFAGEASSWLPTGLPYEGWLECLARCAVGLYGPLELLKLHQLVDCILRNALKQLTIEQAANEVWLETRDSLASIVSSGAAAVTAVVTGATGTGVPPAAKPPPGDRNEASGTVGLKKKKKKDGSKDSKFAGGNKPAKGASTPPASLPRDGSEEADEKPVLKANSDVSNKVPTSSAS